MEKEFNDLKKFLHDSGVAHKIYEHGPIHTAKQASAVRNVDLKTGVKSLVFKLHGGDIVLVLARGDTKVDSKKLASFLNAKNVALAAPEEVREKTGCEVGSVHPFGNLFGLDVYMDKRILENEKVNFSAGLHTISITMSPDDMVKLIKPKLGDFSK